MARCFSTEKLKSHSYVTFYTTLDNSKGMSWHKRGTLFSAKQVVVVKFVSTINYIECTIKCNQFSAQVYSADELLHTP